MAERPSGTSCPRNIRWRSRRWRTWAALNSSSTRATSTSRTGRTDVRTALTGTGQRLYARARKLIPGGTQLLSKRPEMFLPELWPAYYSRAKGAETWDLDGNRYVDVSHFGVGACILGFADP